MGHRTQHTLFENWQVSVNNVLTVVLLADLSEVIDCLPHNLLLAKLFMHGLDTRATSFTYDYFCDYKQRMKIQHSYSTWQNISTGVPLRLVLWTFIVY